MSRALPLAVLLATATWVPSAASSAAVETCQGQEATIVSGPVLVLTGTEGDDVIITGGSRVTRALGGNDLICVTPAGGTGGLEAYVEAGAGEDRVDTTAFTAGFVETRLGAGTDSFVGGSTQDRVYAQAEATEESTAEVISTGAGRDSVYVGRSGEPTRSVVDLGDGNDLAGVLGLPAEGSVDGGPGKDTILPWDGTRADWTVDNAAQTLAADGVSIPMVEFEEFDLGNLAWSALTFVGTSLDERLDLADYLFARKPDGAVRAGLGDGDDTLALGRRMAGTFSGGPGEDRLELRGGSASGRDRVTVDLGRGSVRASNGDSARTTSFVHVDVVNYRHSVVRLDAAANELTVRGCEAIVRAGGGADRVLIRNGTGSCRPWRHLSSKVYGQGGDDEITAWNTADVLVGGGGDDTVDGSRGLDTCVAEFEENCER